MSEFLQTSRLVACLPEINHLAFYSALLSDPNVMKEIQKPVFTAEQINKSLIKAIAYCNKHGFGLCSIFEKAGSKFVGRAGLIHLAYDDSQPDIELGYSLLKKYWGKGYATEISKAFIDWGFQNLPVQQILAFALPENIKSQQVLKKIGMYYQKNTVYQRKEYMRFAIEKYSSIKD